MGSRVPFARRRSLLNSDRPRYDVARNTTDRDFEILSEKRGILKLTPAHVRKDL
jgi:hypothetical protein